MRMILHNLARPRVNTITICMQILNTSKKLIEKENNPEEAEEVIESETDLEERSQYEIDNDAKRYRNKIVLHDTVLISSSVINITYAWKLLLSHLSYRVESQNFRMEMLY